MIHSADSPPVRLADSTKHWDRYIRRTQDLRYRYNTVHNEGSTNPDNILHKSPYSAKREKYKQMLASSFAVNLAKEAWTPTWEVHPRSDPCLVDPTIVLDLPNIRYEYYSNLMDWSATNYLTVGLNRAVYLWHASTNRTIRFRTASTPNCLKWNPEGTNLLTTSRTGSIQLFDMAAEMQLCYLRQTCHVKCYATACVFHPRGNLVVVGCSRGSFTVYSVKGGLKKTVEVCISTNPVMTVSFACDGKHLAVSNADNIVSVYTCPDFRLAFFSKSGSPCRALAWHPWKRGCLMVADVMGGIFMYNILDCWSAPMEPQASYMPYYNSAVYAMLFHPVTAELVVSHRLFSQLNDEELPMYAGTQLNVLASFDRVVDRMEGHFGRVLYLNWSPDANQLVTSGSDETARIWDFMPRSKAQEERRDSKKKGSKLSYESTSLEFASRLGLTIR